MLLSRGASWGISAASLGRGDCRLRRRAPCGTCVSRGWWSQASRASERDQSESRLLSDTSLGPGRHPAQRPRGLLVLRLIREGWGQTNAAVDQNYVFANMDYAHWRSSQQSPRTPFCTKLKVNVRPSVGRWRWGRAPGCLVGGGRPRGFKEHTRHVGFMAFKGARSKRGRVAVPRVALAASPEGRL